MAIKFEQLPNPIQAGQVIRAGHVSQSLVAFAGLDAYDINLSGSFAMTGSIYHSGIFEAAGAAASVLVIDNATGEYYTTGSYASGGGGSGTSGSSGSSGTSGSSGAAGDAGTSGSSGSSGTSGSSGSSGTSGSSGSSGTSGSSGATGDSGTSGSSGSSGTSGSSGVGGVTTAGSNVTVTGAGTVIDPYVVSSTGGGGGTSGSSGSSGTSGSSGSSGTSGSSGAAGDAGTSGSSGSSGTSGSSGAAGDAGTSGSSGSSGTSGSSGSGQAIQILDNGTPITADVESINFVGATITEPTADNVTVTITGGGGGSQNIFTTASVSNSGVKQAAASRIETTTVNDDITFNFINGVSGSTDVSTKTLTVSGLSTPQLYLRKNEESGTGGSQTIPSDSSELITWIGGNDNYKDNSSWFTLNGDSYFEYIPGNSTTYFQILQPGLYEFDTQLKTIGNNVNQTQGSQIIFNRGNLNTPPTPTLIEVIGMVSHQANKTQARKATTAFYVSQTNIDLGENYFYVSVATSVSLGATAQTLDVGGGGSDAIKGNYFSVKLIQ